MKIEGYSLSNEDGSAAISTWLLDDEEIGDVIGSIIEELESVRSTGRNTITFWFVDGE
jgi:hypothetical protein